MKNKVFKIGFNHKSFLIKDYIVCDNYFSKFRGLMFRGKEFSKPLLFVFKNPNRQAIHSFFCEPFLAVWLFNDEIIEQKLIVPNKISVTPAKKFNYLLEIPLKYFS